MVYESIEPFGDRRGDIQAGMICALLANLNRTKESDKLYGPMDFIPKWEEPPVKQQTVEEQVNIMQLIQAMQAERGNPVAQVN